MLFLLYIVSPQLVLYLVLYNCRAIYSTVKLRYRPNVLTDLWNNFYYEFLLWLCDTARSGSDLYSATYANYRERWASTLVFVLHLGLVSKVKSLHRATSWTDDMGLTWELVWEIASVNTRKLNSVPENENSAPCSWEHEQALVFHHIYAQSSSDAESNGASVVKHCLVLSIRSTQGRTYGIWRQGIT